MRDRQQRLAWQENLRQALDWCTDLLLRYVRFLSLLLRPELILTLVMVAVAFWYAKDQKGLPLYLLQVVIAVGGGTAGALIKDAYDRMSGNTFLIKKSASAIRNLQLIKNKVVNTSLRIEALRDDQSGRRWDEVSNLVDNIGKDILNAISDWNDVNPASDAVADVLDSIGENEKAAELLGRQLREAQAARRSAEAESRSSVDELARRDAAISKMEQRIAALQAETASLRQQSSEWLRPSLTASASGLMTASAYHQNNIRVGTGTPVSICDKCHSVIIGGKCRCNETAA